LGYLDAQPDSDQYIHPYSHPGPFGNLFLPNLDAEPE
jgi:hypothetical protein